MPNNGGNQGVDSRHWAIRDPWSAKYLEVSILIPLSNDHLITTCQLLFSWFWHLLMIRLRTSLDVKRTESLKGITVFRGQIPGSCSSKVITNQETSNRSDYTIFVRKLWSHICESADDFKSQTPRKSIFIPLFDCKDLMYPLWSCSQQKIDVKKFSKTTKNQYM